MTVIKDKKKCHFIKFFTSEHKEYLFETEPILYCQDTGIDHLVQCKIVAYIKQYKIKGVEKKYIYYDENMNEIMHNDSPLEHASFELLQK